MPSFSIALTGLQANSVALNTIGNNLANLNTSAYKKQDAQFADLFYQTIGESGANAPIQVGIGTRIDTIDTNFSQGTLTSTTDPANLALNGDGFFVVQKQNGAPQLTRDGSFRLDGSGNLITAEGASVMGYPVVNGAVAQNAPLQPILIPVGATQLPKASSNFSFTAGLDSTAATGAAVNAQATLYDSLGQGHSLTFTFTKTGSNTWSYSAALPTGDATGGTGLTGTLSFNADGTLATPAASSVPVSFTGLADGASNFTLNWQLRNGTGASLITQTAAASSVNATSQDGYPSGSYESFSVDSNGVVSGSFTNGHQQVLGQVAVATVTNASGLARQGNNTYQTTTSSGPLNVGVAGTGNRGTIQGSSLEASNVDISVEFSDLIVAQRSFEANSKTVTAFDTVTQDTINMIR